MNNRLYCTFTNVNDVEEIIEKVQTSYVILFNKINTKIKDIINL